MAASACSASCDSPEPLALTHSGCLPAWQACIALQSLQTEEMVSSVWRHGKLLANLLALPAPLVCSVGMPSLQHGGDPAEHTAAFPSVTHLDLSHKGKFWKQAPLSNKPGNVLLPQGLILWYRKPEERWGLCGQGQCTAALQGTSSQQTRRCCVWPTAPCLL